MYLFNYLFVIFIGIILSGCSTSFRNAAIKITASPEAKVYINGKDAGSTPYENRSLSSGTIELTLITEKNQQWSKKIRLQNNTTTVISWNFSENNEESSGYILYLENTGQEDKVGLLVNAIPDKTAVLINNDFQTYSPTRLDNIGFGDKNIRLSYPGYNSIEISTKDVRGYQLVIDAVLGKQKMIDNNIPPPQDNNETIGIQKYATIKTTETGWLRVRESYSATSSEVAKVQPKEKYKIIEQKEDWIKIDLGNGAAGWISTKYADIL